MRKVKCCTWLLLIAVSGAFAFWATPAVPADTAAELWHLYGVYPYGPMNRKIPGLNPNAGPIEVMLAQGELESVCLAVDNRKGKDTFDFRVEGSLKGFPKGKLRIGKLAYLSPRAKDRKSRNLHMGGQEVADAIVPISSTMPVTVGRGECRHIWLTVDARGVPAGQYPGSVSVRPMTVRQDMRNHEAKRIQINIRVLPFALPDETPLDVLSWDIGSSTRDDEWLANFVEHRQNVFNLRMLGKSRVKLNPDGTLAEKPDFSELTERLLRGKPYGKFFFETFRFRSRDSDKESASWECTDGSRIPHLSDRWAIGYKQWLSAFKAYLESLGIGTDQWYILTHDEALFQDGEKGSLRCAKLTYQVDPTIQFVMDTWPTREPWAALGGQTADIQKIQAEEILKPWRKGTNVTWCPDYGIYNQVSWYSLKAEKRPLWMYFCHQSQRRFSPHAFYRVRGWLAWIWKLDGVAFFAPTVHTGSTWDDLDGPYGDTCVILSGADGEPVNTRRWEAYREGIEDYLYLYLLDNLLKTKKPDAGLAAKARKLMAEACQEFELAVPPGQISNKPIGKGWIVTEDNAKTTQAQRKQIAELIIKLQGLGKN